MLIPILDERTERRDICVLLGPQIFLEGFDFSLHNEHINIHVPCGNGYCKRLIHIVGRNDNDIHASSVRVIYNLIASNHLPFVFVVHYNACFA